MDKAWYSVLLITGKPEERDGLVLEYIVPLLDRLDSIGEDYLFHFFRYSGKRDDPRPFLRLRVLGSPKVRDVAEGYQRKHAEEHGVLDVEPESYNAKLELGPDKPFKSEKEVKKAWNVYDMGSRLAIAVERNRFRPERLRDENCGIAVVLNHLFLNSLGLNIAEEYDVHFNCLIDRFIINIADRLGIRPAQVWERFGGEMQEVLKRLDEVTEILKRTASQNPP
jgi:hypothetical protein